MPTRITPCRTQVSDRFPVASFVVRVPADRYFELAFATDPALFHASHRHDRTVENFHTSRQTGLLRAPAGEATYLVPGGQLRRFAGKQRIYYAIATFSSPRGDDARTSVQFERLRDTPYIHLAQDFTGRALDRSRLSGLLNDEPAYGSRGPELTWGGDLVTEPRATASGALDDYDDGFDPALWQGGAGTDDDGVPAYARSQEEPSAWGGDTDDDPSPEPADETPDHEPYTDDAPYTDDDDLGEAYGSADPGATPHPESYEAAVPVDDVAGSHTWGAPVGEAEPGAAHYGGPAPIDDPYGVFELPAVDAPPAEYGGYGDDAHDPYDTAYDTAHDHDAYDDGPVQHGDPHDPYAEAHSADTPEEETGAYLPPATDPAEWDSAAEAWEPTLLAEEMQEPQVDDWEQDDGYGGLDDQAPVGSGGAVPLTLGAPADPAGAVPFDPVARARVLYALSSLDGAEDPFVPIDSGPDGLRWGLGFDQRSGALGRVLERCRSEDAQAFDLVFGPEGSELLGALLDPDENVRMGTVGGEPLEAETWTQRFGHASGERAFRKAQLKEAVETEIDPHVRFAGRMGLHRDRAFATLVERSRAVGFESAQAEVAEALCPVKAVDLAEGRTDTLDLALTHLGVDESYGGLAERLEAFQEANGDFSGDFTPTTQALLVQALRENPLPGLEVPQGAEVWGALQAYGSADPRLAALWESEGLSDQDLALAEA